MTDIRITREAVDVVTNLTTSPIARVTRLAVEVLTDNIELQLIEPVSIPSEEAFGIPSIVSVSNIAPVSILSAEAFGIPVIEDFIPIAPVSILSAEAFGLPTLSGIIAPSSIPSAESFGVIVVTNIPKRDKSFRVITSLFGTLAVFPLEAVVPCNEEINWLTDVQVSHNGTENRERTRAEPRTILKYRYSEGVSDLAMATLNQYAAMNLNWIVPLWTESQIIGAIASASSVITIDTSDLDFRNNSLALIYESPNLWEIVEISTFTSVDLTLLGVTENQYFNAKVMPARQGLIINGIQKNSTGYSAITSIKYAITDNIALIPADEPDQFLGDDIYFDEIFKKSNSNTYTKKIVTDTSNIDFDLGLFDKLTPFIHNRIISSHSNMLKGKQDIRSFKRLLERRAGRNNQYWEPTFEADLRTTSTGTILTFMNIDIIGQTDWPEIKTYIAIMDKSGTWHPRTIINFDQISTTIFNIELDAPLNIDASEIDVISYLGLKRFNADRIEIKWIGNNIIETNINTLEISS